MNHNEMVAELKRQRSEILMLREMIARKDRRIEVSEELRTELSVRNHRLAEQLAFFKGERRGD